MKKLIVTVLIGMVFILAGCGRTWIIGPGTSPPEINIPQTLYDAHGRYNGMIIDGTIYDEHSRYAGTIH